MNDKQADITRLWEKFEAGTASKAELDLLFTQLNEGTHDKESLAFLEAGLAAHDNYKPLDREYLTNRLQQILGSEKPARIHYLKTPWLRYAAILLLIAGTITYFYTTTPSFRRNPEVAHTQQVTAPQEILPGSNKAILTLSDGSTIILDSAGTGDIAREGNTKILKVNAGSISYRSAASGGEVLYNTISTPKGGQYQVTLPDGTNVWLNAVSSIRFPTSAADKERIVEITGESYFEIAPDKNKPFYVKVGNMTIQVLGTSFNVNAYDNESSINTTLLEGAVRVQAGDKSAGNEVSLKPGQQASVSRKAGESIAVKNKVRMENILAWKNGVFNFDGANLGEVMRQLERWYNIEVVYEKGIPNLEFVGKMRRDLKLSDVLRGLEVSEVHFKTEGRKVTVMP